MPYISQESRKFVDPLLEELLKHLGMFGEGDLNYAITKIIHLWIRNKGLCYKNLNAAIGVLDCAKMELYRVVAAPYEDGKQMENGSISELDNGS